MEQLQISQLKKNSNNSIVIQSNDFILNSSNDLSVLQAKVLFFLISCIERDDIKLPIIHMDYHVLIKLLSMEQTLTSKTRIEKFLRTLSEQVYFEMVGKTLLMRPWFSMIKINFDENDDIISFAFNPTLKENLLNLSKNFTQYKLCFILDFDIVYSIKLYELLSSFIYKKTLSISLDDLRASLNLKNKVRKTEKFEKFKDLKRRVLEPSIKEINEKSDIKVSYKIIQDPLDRRKTWGVEFEIKKNNTQPKYIIPDYYVETTAEQFGMKGENRIVSLKKVK